MGSPFTALPLRAGSSWVCSSCRLHASRQPSRTKQRTGQRWSDGGKRGVATSNGDSGFRHSPLFENPTLEKDDLNRRLSAHHVRDILLQAQIRSPSQQHDPYGLLSALRRKSFDAINAAVVAASRDPAYFRRIPKATWTEILRGLAPSKTLLPLHRIHRSFSARQLEQAGYDQSNRQSVYLDTLMHVVRLRRDHSPSFDVVDYQILLQHAASLGHELTANVFWNNMKRDGVEPDRLCYNAYMEAVVWNERSRARRRRRLDTPKELKGRNPNDVVLFFPGALGTAHKIAQQMTAAKIAPDTNTYCSMITGLARDGQIDNIWTILASVWGIDRDAITEKHGHTQPSFIVPYGSLTFPNQRLLVTLADAFGSVNQVINSVYLVVSLCRNYGLTMQPAVWYQISKWIWLQSRVKPEQRANTSTNTLPVQAIEDTAQIMQDAFGIEPSMEQFNVFFQAAENPFKHPLSLVQRLEMLEAGRTRYADQTYWYEYSRQPAGDIDPQEAQPRHVKQEQLQMRKRMSHHMLQRWCRSLIKSTGTPANKGVTNEHLSGWRLRGIPHLLLRYRDFCPSLVKYSVNTGMVELVLRTVTEVDEDRLRKPAADRLRYEHFDDWIEHSEEIHHRPNE